MVLSFFVIHLAPGDPVTIIVGPSYTGDPEFLEQLRIELGLNRPLYEQLGDYLLRAFKGDLGYSYTSRMSVVDIIMSRLPNTLLLMACAMVFATFFGILLGVASSLKPYSLVDNLTSAACLIGYCLPIFWLAQTLIMVFSLNLGWFPVQGMTSSRLTGGGLVYFLDLLHHLVLPTVALGMFFLTLIARMTRGSMLKTLWEDYVTTARSKGLPERVVIFKHVLRNALLPIVTVIGSNIAFVFAGAVLSETVFGWPGMGRLLYESILSRDYMVILGMFIFISIGVVVVNLVTDVIYGLLDPRVKYNQ